MDVQLIKTKDDSHTLFVPEMDEHYHSIFGAIQESQHVFINAGFKYSGSNNIKIFEVGFGTGLNTLLTIIEAMGSGTEIYYYSIDNYYLDIKIIQQLNYPDILELNDIHRNLFYRIHSEPCNKEIKLTDNFTLKKLKSDFTKFNITFQYDLVYFDAFAPEKQPEMWSRDIFEKIYNNLSDEGLLVTYCAKGIVKRILRSAGFNVRGIPGPAGKREMIRAHKT
jgi:tRNA U34 5-methylaminomethyl-2-thiouridine-forming methyltransferase MnmC